MDHIPDSACPFQVMIELCPYLEYLESGLKNQTLLRSSLSYFHYMQVFSEAETVDVL